MSVVHGSLAGLLDPAPLRGGELAQEGPSPGGSYEDASVWAPLSHPVFRSLWIADFASLVGTWMHEVGAGWLMTSLTSDPLLVCLVQVATTLPILLLALPAGALADVVDRRRLLLTAQVWASIAAATLSVVAVFGRMEPATLLALTFAVGLGTAASRPAWLALIGELVPARQRTAAVALDGISTNASRALAPALGGAIIATIGAGWAFGLNAASFLGVVTALLRWKRPKRVSALPAERLFGAIRAGGRYLRHAPALRAVLWRGAAFVFPASAFWALLPLLARSEFELGPEAYGLMVGSIGLGAVAAAALLPAIRRVDRQGRAPALAWLLFAFAIFAVAHIGDAFGACLLLLFAAGSAWMVLMTSFIAGAQSAAATWVRGRGLAVYLFVYGGGMAVGSVFWGYVARLTSPPTALVLAAGAALAGLLLTLHLPISTRVEDLTPSRRWREAQSLPAALLERGPVAVTVEYRIDPATVEAFRGAVGELRRLRLRDGAIRWELYSDPSDASRYQEFFMVESWVEHLRQHDRLTEADTKVLKRCHSFHVGEPRQKVSHWLAEAMGPRRSPSKPAHGGHA